MYIVAHVSTQHTAIHSPPPSHTQVLEEMQLPGCLDRRPSRGLHVTVMSRHKIKRLMSFATVVKSAMDRQTVADMNSP